MSDACSSCESNSHSKNGVRISRWLRFVAAFTSLSLLGFSSACGTSDAVGPDPLLARILIVASVWYLVITSVLMVLQVMLEKHFGKGFEAKADSIHSNR